ncbi:MAG: C40 family peptidase [Actinomycetes bacterium]
MATATAITLVPVATAATANAAPVKRAASSLARFVPPVTPITPTMTPAEVKHAQAEALRAKVVRLALTKKKHGQYVAGAASNLRFDCSGFTMVVYRQAVGKRLPHYSGAQMQSTQRVSRAQLLPGDLLFWGAGGSQHASMYLGRGLMIGANSPSSGVVIESMNSSYWRPRYAGAGRVIKG